MKDKPNMTTGRLAIPLAARGLRVTGVREDGFHLIDAEMVTLDLADDLEVQPLPPGGTTVVWTSWLTLDPLSA